MAAISSLKSAWLVVIRVRSFSSSIISPLLQNRQEIILIKFRRVAPRDATQMKSPIHEAIRQDFDNRTSRRRTQKPGHVFKSTSAIVEIAESFKNRTASQERADTPSGLRLRMELFL